MDRRQILIVEDSHAQAKQIQTLLEQAQFKTQTVANAEEALLMVEAGMPEMAVLVAATINAADLVDMSDSIGTIEAGKFADIIAVDESPLEDIAALLDVAFVMKGGKVYKD